MLKNDDEAQHTLALTLVPGIGPFKAKNLIAYCGSARAVFQTKAAKLISIPDIGPAAVKALKSAPQTLRQAEVEINFAKKFDIDILLHHVEGYPYRLKQCNDSPVILYWKGKGPIESERVISIVGTRSATSYGKQFISELLEFVKPYNPIVVSGLAYGVDICAHRVSLEKGLPTIACLAHGLDRVYPPMHTSVARSMIEAGGLLTEFPSGTNPDRELFPARNRIIAGLSDCTIVVETDSKGGSIITAYLAHSYSREVFAVPGRINDRHSSGCNMLIRKNVAALLTSGADLVDYLGWDEKSVKKTKQLVLFQDLSEDRKLVVQLLLQNRRLPVDRISREINTNLSAVNELLLNMEFDGIIKSLPGKLYELNPCLTFDM
ncbi:MAG: DNA-processing protein DprA [Flavobacteriales bacterium]